MATKQTRRSISVRGETYDSLRQFCATSSRSMSDVVEEQLARVLNTSGSSKTVAPHVARKPVSASSEKQSAPSTQSTGRPAPTPAIAVIRTRTNVRKNDYRSIKF